MPRQRNPMRPPRSTKAGVPPEPHAEAPRVRRRQRSAQAAVRKDSALLQPPADPRARWPAAKPKFPKR
jgi:hypothetical protein